MSVTATEIAQYAPHGNAVLSFDLAFGAYAVDPETGNIVTPKKNHERIEYLAHLNLTKPQWKGEPGVDQTVYLCQGRLLHPAKFDDRITNGTQADATINGYRGRFELVWDLTMDKGHYTDLRQSIEGTFRVIGGKG